MNVSNLDVSHKREGWKDWFIIDSPVKCVNLHIWSPKQQVFSIDPSFDYYEVTGTIDSKDPPVFILTYMFEDERSIRKEHVSTYRLKGDDNKHFKIFLRKKRHALEN